MYIYYIRIHLYLYVVDIVQIRVGTCHACIMSKSEFCDCS